VQRASNLARDPQLLAGGFWDHMERRYVGRHLMANSPWTYDARRPALRRPAPVLGEHTGEVVGPMEV